METVEFPALSESDEPLVDRLSLGLGQRPARVLAYLVLRRESPDVDDPRASQLLIRVGTGLGRQPLIDALSTLSDTGVIEETTLDVGRGRPPKAWCGRYDLEETVERVYRQRAGRLLSQATAQFLDVVGDTDTAGREDTSGVELALNWLPNGLHVPFYAASISGAYTDCGVETTFTHHRGSRRALSAVVDGAADVGIVGAATLVKARENDESVVPIAVLYQRAMAVLYTTRSAFGEPFESAEQLCGRRVGMTPETETGLLGRLFLARTGLEDIRIVETAGEEAEALRSGAADVVAGSFSDPDKLREQNTVDVLRISDQFPIYGPALVVRPETLRRRRRTLESFLVGTMFGWADARDDPKPTLRHVASLSDDDQTELAETFRRALIEFADSKYSNESGWGYHEAAGWERIRIALLQTTILDS